MAVHVADKDYAAYVRKRGVTKVKVANIEVPVLFHVGNLSVIYRHPVVVRERSDQFTVDGVFAVLTGVKDNDFAGNRADYRDLINVSKRTGSFIYVLPVTSVTTASKWTGYVRIGRKKWVGLPCPRPLAIYNRITLRNLERSPDAVVARKEISDLGIPMFNPTYFDKAKVC